MKNLLSFGELKKMVGQTAGTCLPTARQLRSAGSPIAVQKKFADGSCLTAYQNGFALFQTTSRATVFRVDACGDYTYFTRTETHIFEEQYFDDKAWYIRLQLEAEDRLLHNEQVRENETRIVNRVAGDIAGFAVDGLDTLIAKEELSEMLQVLTEKQRRVLLLHSVYGYTQASIAKMMGVSQPAIAKILEQAKKKMKKNFK